MKKYNLFLASIFSLLVSQTIYGQNYFEPTTPTGLTGSDNTGIGAGTQFSITSGNSNNSVGYQSLYSNLTGQYNDAIGEQALYSNTASYNEAMGFHALYSGTGSTAIQNVGIGAYTLANNQSGNSNTAIGYSAMAIGYANYNVAVGCNALYHNTSSSNTIVGYAASYYDTSGVNDVFGYEALYYNRNGTANVAVGYNSMYNNFASYNTAVGNQSLYNNTTGDSNVAMGYKAMYSNTTAQYNVGIGNQALYSNTTQQNNTAVGLKSLYSNLGGFNNTALGTEAGALYADDTDCTFIGEGADAKLNGLTNASSIGYQTMAQRSNSVTLGNTAITMIFGAVTSITSYSDKRVKKDIQENVPGLAFIKNLRPVTYHFDIHKMDQFEYGDRAAEYEKQMAAGIAAKEKILYTGFIAQEVEASAKKVGYDFSGIKTPQNSKDLYGLNYSDFVVPLVKAMQEQQGIIDTLNDTVKVLSNTVAQQQQLIAQQQEALNNVLAKVETLAAQLYEIKECCNSNGNLNNGTGNNTDGSPLTAPALFNAVPNPVSGSTAIYYYVPASYKAASIQISDMNGQVLQTIVINTSGYSSSTLDARNLANATYSYSLIVDGKIIATKNLSVVLR